MTRLQIDEQLRGKYVNAVGNFFRSQGEHVHFDPTMPQKLFFPVVDVTGAERWCAVTISLPKGSKEQPFDGYVEGEEWEGYRK